VLATGLVACEDEINTIDRTQPNAVDKRNFEGIWYHRATIIEADPEAPAVEGIAGSMEKIRWEIREEWLVAYRSYELIPFAEGLTDEGRDFFGSPVAAFPISSHFDIQREYNPTTGVQSNVISENTTDRPWFQRRFMRVDWSQNLVGQPTLFGFGSLNGILSGFANTAFFIQGDEETNPNRPLLTENYMDVTNIYALSPSSSYCLFQLLFNSVPRCGTANVQVRLSFRKVDQSDDYEPLYYPDVVEYLDDDGNPRFLDDRDVPCQANDSPDNEPCYFRGFEYDGRFGNFRINRVAFDSERFQTRAGRVFLAGRFDLWDDTFDDTGARIPEANRRPEPVIFYNNPKMPENIQDASINYGSRLPPDEAADTVGAWWSEPFDQSVAFRMGFTNPEGTLPDIEAFRNAMVEQYGGTTEDWQMFQIRRNDCNKDNIIAYAEANGLTGVIDRVAGGNEQIQVGNLERVCAAVQFAELEQGKTLDPAVAARTGQELAFTWQRKGDLRYNFNNYVLQLSNGPWGVAQFGQDPETGEFVANIANYFSDAGDRISTSSMDIIQWLNGDLTTEDIISGNTTRRFSRRVEFPRKIQDDVKAALDADAASKFSRKASSGVGRNDIGGGLTDQEKYEAMFAHSQLEREMLITEDMLRMFAGPQLYQPADGIAVPANPDLGLPGAIPGQVTPEALEAASPVNWLFDLQNSPYEQAVVELGANGFDMADFFDPNVSALADEFQGQPRSEIFDFLQTELFKAIQGHEVGHTVGLRHNFNASMDPLNYRPEFWEVFYNQGDFGRPTASQPTRGQEYKYASIMDYGFDFGQQGWHGLGSYDKAAVRFMYGQLVDVWDNSKIAIPDARRYGNFVERCGRVNDDYFDEGIYMDDLQFFIDPLDIPRIFGQAPVDRPECKGQVPNYNYNDDESCDTALDANFRAVAQEVDQSVEITGLPNICFEGQSLLDAILEVQDLEPNTSLIYGARAMAPVEQLIQQELGAFDNDPESPDEAFDGIDNDGDGVIDDRGYDWSQWKHEIPYEYCSDLQAGFSNPFCQRWDAGWDFLESVQNSIIRYDRDYIWRSFQRDRSNFGSPLPLLINLVFRRFKIMSDVYQYFVFTQTADDDIGRYNDWQEAAYLAANFLERVLQSPEPGTYCLDSDNVYRLQDNLPPNTVCDQPYEVGLGYGEGAFLADSWNEEYFFNTTVLGSFWDKWAAMFMITRSSGFFAFDLSQVFDRRSFSLPYLRTWQDPALQRMNSLISADFEGYRSRIAPVDPADPDGERMVFYTPWFDEQFSETRDDQFAGQSVRTWLRDNDFPQIEPSWSYDLRLWALAFALSNWSSTADLAVEYYRLSKVSLPGTPDHTEYTGVDTVTFIDPETNLEYQAPEVEPFVEQALVSFIDRSYYGNSADRRAGNFKEWSVGAELIKQANQYKSEVYEPARQACELSAPDTPVDLASTPECTTFQQARNELADQVGFLNQLRRFTVRAERIYQ
jgi:hypothetical protein